MNAQVIEWKSQIHTDPMINKVFVKFIIPNVWSGDYKERSAIKVILLGERLILGKETDTDFFFFSSVLT